MKRSSPGFWLSSLFAVFSAASAFGAIGDTVWVDDAVPAGAWTSAERGDQWSWVTNNPTPFSGTSAHQSAAVAGIHNHYFSDAVATLPVNAGDTLITYVYLNPANPPREIMLFWYDGSSWMHAAYWGENLIPWGVNGTASQRPMGPLPPAGRWERLEVPAGWVDLNGRTVLGMNFVLYDGQATWDYSGKSTNAPRPTVSLQTLDALASEHITGDVGQYIIHRTGERSTESELTVHITVSGTASNGVDYEFLTNSITLPQGQESAVFSIVPINDRILEPSETVVVTLANDAAYRVSSTNSGTVTIVDDDETPRITISGSTFPAWEREPDPPFHRGVTAFSVDRTGDISEPLTIRYVITGTAINGTDYEPISDSITIATGASANQIFIMAQDDAEPEPDETVTITMEPDDDYIVETASATVIIRDNDQPTFRPIVGVDATDPEASETGGSPGTFTIRRSGGDPNSTLTVYLYLFGTATNGSDYFGWTGPAIPSPSNSVTFAAGQMATILIFSPHDDTEVEGDETIVLGLVFDEAYQIGTNHQAAITIEDNDQSSGAPAVSLVSEPTARENVPPGGPLPDYGTFSFSRSGPTNTPLTIDFTVGGSASNGTDYESIPGSITLPAGASSGGFGIRPIDDALAEGPETVVLTLRSNASYTLGTSRSATVTIADDDNGPPRLLIRRENNGVVEVAVQGEHGRSYLVEASSNLVNWTAIGPGSILTSFPLVFRDGEAPNHPLRFYRAQQE